MPRVSEELRFRAMGSDCHVVVVGGPGGGADLARRRIDDLERRWSRFLDDSEVSRLNRRAGQPVRVSPETRELVERAGQAWRLSGGAFDPTVLGAVVRAGYDRSFERIAGRRDLASDSASGAYLRLGAAEIVIDGDAVTLPPGVGFDPGGIGKGLAADRVVAEMMALGVEGICVNLGGDVRLEGAAPGRGDLVRGDPDSGDPDGRAWTVAVEHPRLDAPLALLGLTGGAVATSTTLRRRWTVGGRTRHHLIDPQTGQPSTSDIELATVVAAQAWAAEVLAKAVLLRGSEHPFDNLGGTGAQALAVDRTGRVHTTPGLAAFLGRGGVGPAVRPGVIGEW
jgi:thiamine biosynthesis lipoprotein